jgi:hypothetical protein
LELSNGNCVFNIVDLHLKKKTNRPMSNFKTTPEMRNPSRFGLLTIMNHY